MSRGLHFEFIYKHSPQRVWRALTDSAAIARWLMPNDFQPVVGHKFQLRTKPRPGFDGIVKCEVLDWTRRAGCLTRGRAEGWKPWLPTRSRRCRRERGFISIKPASVGCAACW